MRRWWSFRRLLCSILRTFVALQEIRNTEEMIKEKTKLPPGTPVLTPSSRREKAIQ